MEKRKDFRDSNSYSRCLTCQGSDGQGRVARGIGKEWNMNPVEENMEKALQYFDIPKSETKEGFYLASNNKNMRDVTGISAVEECCKEGGRFRITTYYDPEFPSIVTCVTKCQ